MTRRIFIDTNIFIRFLLKDDPQQSPIARKIIENAAKEKYILVSFPAIILEIAWLLGSLYKFPKNKIIEAIIQILSSPCIQFIDKPIIERAIFLYQSCNIDLIDAFVAATMRQEKISEIFSFDHDFDKLPDVKRLEKI